ncbi:hypothetical protein HUK80_09845 [Flavobacterium sp. MAH-1]|uniref:Signal transducing protein n=1 Tax=Flavobacterium agri TaxID=2743471 RepID=A0A7Y9C5P7_9FLAO|nr:hypothetical protein [Flavobacterium agri]NUY81196.1 hypothetical protein [Flavobacterium agri]NYA71220.1 hypothetical protein [Flavobacterium agri]
MMQKNVVTYKVFSSKQEVIETAKILQGAGIEIYLDDYSQIFDPSFSNIQGEKEYRIKLDKDNFGEADAVLEAAMSEQLGDVPADYYLFSFSNGELKEILAKREEWNLFDYVLSKKILSDRGLGINESELEIIREKHMAELAQPAESQHGSIIIGFIFALAGGFLGILIGWYISSQKKTLPNGEQLFAFNDADRRWGKRICFFSVFMWIFWMGLIFWLKN